MSKIATAKISKREDRPKEQGLKQYGDVDYADETNKAYPIDTEAHIRSAWNYIHKAANRAKYSGAELKTMEAKIVAAWKKKIDKAGPPAAAEGMQICGEVAWEIGGAGQAPEGVLYMPAGDHTIFCRVNGEPKEIDVHVDADTAEMLQADLEELLKADVKPFIDYNHKGEASAATPLRFTWVEGDGLYLELEWSRSGKENVEGKDFKHFSPTFQIDKDGYPTGLPESGPIGALVNNPAFRQQKEILDQIAAELAADARAASKPKPKQKSMSIAEAGKGLKALAKELFGDDAPDEDDDQMPEKILKKIKAMKKSLQDAEAKAKKAADDADDAKGKKEEAEAELVTLRESKAAAAVDAVIAAGKMPGKDEKTRKFYVESYLRDPVGTQHALDALGARSALKPLVKVDGADRRDIGGARVAAEAAEGQADKLERGQMMAQRALIAKVKAANPGIDADSLIILARQEYPDAFVEA
jgi:phage I-like protein